MRDSENIWGINMVVVNSKKSTEEKSVERTGIRLLADFNDNYWIYTNDMSYFLDAKEKQLILNVLQLIIAIKDDTKDEVLRYDRAWHLMKEMIELKELTGDYDNAW